MSDYEDEKEIDRLAKLVERLTEEAASLRAEVGRLEKALRDKIAELERESAEHYRKECRSFPRDCWCDLCEGRKRTIRTLQWVLSLYAALSAQPAPDRLSCCPPKPYQFSPEQCKHENLYGGQCLGCGCWITSEEPKAVCTGPFSNAYDCPVHSPALQKPAPEKPVRPAGIPRASFRPEWCEAEGKIQAAIDSVESMGADVRLTKAVVLLAEAQGAVADFVDQPAPEKPALA